MATFNGCVKFHHISSRNIVSEAPGLLCFFPPSYQFLEDAYRNHRDYMENMTLQLQEKKKAIEEVSNSINNGYASILLWCVNFLFVGHHNVCPMCLMVNLTMPYLVFMNFNFLPQTLEGR